MLNMLEMKVAVVGGGRMGSGIAHAFLVAGAHVWLIEVDDAAADLARQTVVGTLHRAADRGFLTEDIDGVGRRLHVVGGIEALENVPDAVIEAVPEDVRLKTEILGRLSQRFGAEVLIASNTSSISIDELSTVVKHPERFVGMHFFNPVPASRLVEVVRGSATSEDIVGRAVGLVDALLKQPVVVSDSPGFASSRLGVLLGLEAIRMLEEGVASAQDIDLAMELGYGHRMGPLRSTDLVGLDVRLGIAEYLEQELGPRFAPPALLRKMTEQGHLGRKSGSGFFEWEK